ncbi:LysR family transcriptional regulator [Alkalibaculum sp. M08DMB]|uniref:LysR family transcriptional regulator n=1 Tax=Alkalibaculum sporogenes TaxID=2655001 RepID=A0A6A7K4Q3_9FIRM|nr:LysR family transcriptional regulator [Alkalibaculum sporogenes]MPW24237.1 LysR family transcriptional regulator [Alkalibaculum sporogenes]
MNLTQIKYFIAAGKYLNFTKAAEELFTTQPTISKQIDSLEKDLGFKLFERNRKKMKLTPCGDILLEEFQKVIVNLEKAISRANQVHSGNGGHLNIGFPTSLDITGILPGVFKQFTVLYPDIILDLFTYNFKNLKTKLIEDDLDLILTRSFEKISDDSKFISKIPISRSNPRVYFNKQSLNLPDTYTFEDLKNIPLILLGDNEFVLGNKYVLALALKYGLNTTNIIRANTLETMFVYIESGAGISILGSSYQIFKSNNISNWELEERKNQVGTDMFWKSETQNHSVEVFINYIKNYLKTMDLKRKNQINSVLK